jgi:thymidylate synthase
MNNLDRQYIDLLKDIMENGIVKEDRTGVGTKSVFGRTIRHKMSDGFPLLTSKRMFTKGIIIELLWFLNGDTNIKYLVDNGVNIWTGDAYKKYKAVVNAPTSCPECGEGYDNEEEWAELPHCAICNEPKEFLIENEFTEKIKTSEAFAKKYGDLGPIYGKQWRDWAVIDTAFPFHHDQISTLLDDLARNPDSRRLLVNAWNVGELDLMTLPPCHYGFQCYTRELSLEKRVQIFEAKYNLGAKNIPAVETLDTAEIPKRELSLMWTQRSVDTLLGLPFNIASYAFLLEMLCQQVNMIPGELIGNLGDTHLYLNHIDAATDQLTSLTYTLPKLSLTRASDLYSYKLGDFKIENYKSAATIKAKLNN